VAREKKKQERIDLAPAQALQPKARSIRYDNVRSAVAEEQIIAQALREPALLDLTGNLTKDRFSVDLFGRVYDQLYRRHTNGLEVGLGVLEDLSEEEMSHVAGLYQRLQGPVNEAAFRDCVKTVLQQQDKKVTSNDDLLAFRNKLKESKGTNQ
jgi:DNA primase